MALLIAAELFTLQFAIRTLSSVRALVGAEGLWSKAQKDAAYSLQKYGRTHNEIDYQAYLNYLRVPLGDRKARLEMFKEHPDMGIVREGFIEGRFHPNDIEGPFEVLRRFHDVSYINKAIRLWSRGDTLITSFMSVGERLHAEVISGTASAESINAILLMESITCFLAISIFIESMVRCWACSTASCCLSAAVLQEAISPTPAMAKIEKIRFIFITHFFTLFTNRGRVTGL